MLNLKDLRYLVALADTRHFGRAAERCFVSQPTLSTQLKKLQEQLGGRLIERRHRNVLLTDLGKEVVERARKVLDDTDQIVTLARSRQDPMAGQLRIGLIPTIGPYLLPKIVPAIRKAFPQLELRLVENKTERLIEQLDAGEIDVAVLALPIGNERFEKRSLFEDPFMAALPHGHPLTARKRLRVSDLADDSLLLLEDGHCLRDQALDVCAHAGVAVRDEFRATSLETLRQMVAAGAGVTLLPELTQEGPVGQRAAIAIRPFVAPVPSRDVGMVWRRSSARSETIQAIGDLIESSVRQHAS